LGTTKEEKMNMYNSTRTHSRDKLYMNYGIVGRKRKDYVSRYFQMFCFYIFGPRTYHEWNKIGNQEKLYSMHFEMFIIFFVIWFFISFELFVGNDYHIKGWLEYFPLKQITFLISQEYKNEKLKMIWNDSTVYCQIIW